MSKFSAKTLKSVNMANSFTWTFIPTGLIVKYLTNIKAFKTYLFRYKFASFWEISAQTRI